MPLIFFNSGIDERYSIHLKLGTEAAQIMGDEKLLFRAINNLIHNSIRHNPEGCEIILETKLSKDGSKYRFIVKDNGKGIPQEQLKDITELPYSPKRKGTIKQGHGLGLPMVARIAKAHHGSLILENDVDQRGLKVIMEFPVNHRSVEN